METWTEKDVWGRKVEAVVHFMSGLLVVILYVTRKLDVTIINTLCGLRNKLFSLQQVW